MTWLKRIVAIVLVVAVLAAIVYAMLPKPIVVELGTVSRGTMQVDIEEDGRSRVKDRYLVAAPVTGELQRIELRAGQQVQEGTVLAHIAPTDAPLLDQRTRNELQARAQALGMAVRQARAQAERARLAHELAQRELARVETLASSQAVPQQALDDARMREQTASKDLESAELGIRMAAYELEMVRATLQPGGSDKRRSRVIEVKAPVAATVLRVHQESAGVVAAGSPLLELGDAETLEVVVDLLTTDAVKVESGARVELQRWGGEAHLEGRVRLVEPSAFTKISALGVEEQRVNVIIDPVSAQHWHALGDGYRVEAKIAIWRAEDVVQVPASALFRDDGGWAVFIVDADEAIKRAVQVGRRNDRFVEVREGLGPGDTVVVHPSDRVQAGVKVVGR